MLGWSGNFKFAPLSNPKSSLEFLGAKKFSWQLVINLIHSNFHIPKTIVSLAGKNDPPIFFGSFKILNWKEQKTFIFSVKYSLILGSQGIFLIAFGLSVELVGSKRKTLVGNMIQVPFAIGESIIGLVAMGIRLLQINLGWTYIGIIYPTILIRFCFPYCLSFHEYV